VSAAVSAEEEAGAVANTIGGASKVFVNEREVVRASSSGAPFPPSREASKLSLAQHQRGVVKAGGGGGAGDLDSHRVHILPLAADAHSSGMTARAGASKLSLPAGGGGLLGTVPHTFVTVPELITPPYYAALHPRGACYPPEVTSNSNNAAVGEPSDFYDPARLPLWLPALCRSVFEQGEEEEEEGEVVGKGNRGLSSASAALLESERNWLTGRINRILATQYFNAQDKRKEELKQKEWDVGKAALKCSSETGTLLQRRKVGPPPSTHTNIIIALGSSVLHALLLLVCCSNTKAW